MSELNSKNAKMKGEILNCINSYNQSIECNEIIDKILNENSLDHYLRTKGQVTKRMIDELKHIGKQSSVDEFFF